jgi:uncharacterized protein YybS (DUF2232 family)
MTQVFATGFFVLVAAGLMLAANGVIWLGLKRGWTPRACVTAGTLALLGLAAGILLWGQAATGIPMGQAWRHELNASLNTSLAVYRQLGVEEAELQRSLRWIQLLFIEAAAGWAVLAALGAVYFFYRIQRQWASQLPGSKIALKPWILWTVPDALVWPLLATLVLLSWGRSWGQPYFLAGLNAAVVLGNLYFLGGLAIAMFHMDRWRMPRFFQLLLVILIGFFPTLIGMLVMVGILNTWWDWRRVKPPQTAE